MKRTLLALTLLLPVLPAVASAASSSLPVEIQSSKGISFYNGGVGLGERGMMPQLYPLKIVLATDKGLYLNDAEIVVSRGGEEVLSVRANNGPWVVADLPPGSYTLRATLEGRTATASVKVSAGAKKVVILSWKTADIDMGL